MSKDIEGKKRLGSTRDDNSSKVTNRVVKKALAKGTARVTGDTNLRRPGRDDRYRQG